MQVVKSFRIIGKRRGRCATGRLRWKPQAGDLVYDQFTKTLFVVTKVRPFRQYEPWRVM